MKRPIPRADHDAGLGEERRGLGSVDHGPQLVVLAVELVDHQGPVAVADQAVHEVLDGRPQNRLVVTGEEVGGHDEGDS